MLHPFDHGCCTTMGILESQEPNYHNLGFFGPLNMFSSKATQAQTNLSI